MSEPIQWAQVTPLKNGNYICENCDNVATKEYAFDDSVFYYCNTH
jgi:late competence protein required for DNA uptake (superfamily II DNA/RNA helicase)